MLEYWVQWVLNKFVKVDWLLISWNLYHIYLVSRGFMIGGVYCLVWFGISAFFGNAFNFNVWAWDGSMRILWFEWGKLIMKINLGSFIMHFFFWGGGGRVGDGNSFCCLNSRASWTATVLSSFIFYIIFPECSIVVLPFYWQKHTASVN